MAKAKATTQNYQQLRDELETVLDALQRDDVDVDAALKQYRRGLELVKELEAYLGTAENQIKELQATFNTAAK